MPCAEEKLAGSNGSGPPQRASTLPSRSRTETCDGRVSTIGRPAIVAVGVDHQVGRAGDVGPGGEVLAGRVEDLHAVVLAVAHEDAPVGVDPDAVRQVELARPVAGLAPRLEQLAGGGEAVHARVAVP